VQSGNVGRLPYFARQVHLLVREDMNRFLKYWRLTERGEAFSAHVVSYADDFVILSRGRAAQSLTWTKAVMTKLGLTLNEAKTSLRNAQPQARSCAEFFESPKPFRDFVDLGGVRS